MVDPIFCAVEDNENETNGNSFLLKCLEVSMSHTAVGSEWEPTIVGDLEKYI